jgi:hypothetical protein
MLSHEEKAYLDYVKAMLPVYRRKTLALRNGTAIEKSAGSGEVAAELEQLTDDIEKSVQEIESGEMRADMLVWLNRIQRN